MIGTIFEGFWDRESIKEGGILSIVFVLCDRINFVEIHVTHQPVRLN
jgi:hypothetical protein